MTEQRPPYLKRAAQATYAAVEEGEVIAVDQYDSGDEIVICIRLKRDTPTFDLRTAGDLAPDA